MASASVTRAKIEGFSSIPPTDFVFSMVKNPPSVRALTTGLVSSRILSCSSAAAAISGMRSRAFWTCGWTVGIVLDDPLLAQAFRLVGRDAAQGVEQDVGVLAQQGRTADRDG